MSPYDIQRTGRAINRYFELRSRAIAAGRVREFDYWYDDVLQTLRDPTQALRVGRDLGMTSLPGGFYRDWHHRIFYLRYAIFPDAECGWIYELEIEPKDWVA